MIHPSFFFNVLKENNINFFAGVPDSLLKSICAYIAEQCDEQHHTITAHEGAAIALATGYHIATGNIPMVYMQNSGLGNCINPLTSLIDKEVYKIPLLLMIGWRGEPGTKDEPQHIKQGKVTIPLLESIGIKHFVLDNEEESVKQQLQKAIHHIKEHGEPYAIVVRKGTFEPYSLSSENAESSLTMSREEAIQIVAENLVENEVIVATTGMISRELFEYRENKKQDHSRDFLTVGSMGHASQIALGIALQQPHRDIFCFDGDGAMIMHMGAMAINASKAMENFYHIVFNNGAHDSVGGQPTIAFQLDMPTIAKGCGYPSAYSVSTQEELVTLLSKRKSLPKPLFIEIKVKKGNRKDLGRPTTTPQENKEALMNFLK